MNVERLNFDCIPRPSGPYVHATRHSGLLFFSGLTATGTESQYGNVREQLQAIFSQLEAMLRELDGDLSQVVKVTVFIKDMAYLRELRATLFTLYGKHLPASSAVAVNALYSPELLVEIEAVVADKRTV